ncbi:hypothetical protein X474_24110 [Dethiosulfatarculus sandiegensis]|uniref:Uncharacterized protein n=1 Tax=Dethiosulfatarculus sandiegensis TaxID=1429043 RepID=A0A0D2J787_9BACT|nr:hypothetical protein X474_24110 [Dethiosulfatarculus sandiegensis]
MEFWVNPLISIMAFRKLPVLTAPGYSDTEDRCKTKVGRK